MAKTLRLWVTPEDRKDEDRKAIQSRCKEFFMLPRLDDQSK